MALAVGLMILSLRVYWWLIIAEVILSWVPRGASEPVWLSSIRRFVNGVTEPYLSIFRKIIPTVGAGGVGFDLSPILALIVLTLVTDWLLPLFSQ